MQMPRRPVVLGQIRPYGVLREQLVERSGRIRRIGVEDRPDLLTDRADCGQVAFVQLDRIGLARRNSRTAAGVVSCSGSRVRVLTKSTASRTSRSGV